MRNEKQKLKRIIDFGLEIRPVKDFDPILGGFSEWRAIWRRETPARYISPAAIPPEARGAPAPPAGSFFNPAQFGLK